MRLIITQAVKLVKFYLNYVECKSPRIKRGVGIKKGFYLNYVECKSEAILLRILEIPGFI